METALSTEQRAELRRQALQQAEVNVENARMNLLIAEAALAALLKDGRADDLIAGRPGGE